MIRLGVLATVLTTLISTATVAQPPTFTEKLNLRASSNMGVWDEDLGMAFGADGIYDISWLGPVKFYPAVDIFVGEHNPRLQAQANLLVRPLGNMGVLSAWYLAGGPVIRERTLFDSAMTGIEFALGRARPYFETWFIGNVLGGEPKELEMFVGCRIQYRR